MPIRNSTPTHWTPKGLTDARDGTNSFGGAMKQLVNLIPDPTTAGEYVCRPAALPITSFQGANAPTVGTIMSLLLTIGDLEYGMIASQRNAGKDEPYCFDLVQQIFLPVGGITNGNTPTTQASSGDWRPPIATQVAGRVIVTHPGFPGGATKFGWFDVSGFTETTTGNENTSTLITGNPSIVGVQPGMTITGANIPPGTTVVSTAEFVLTTSGILNGNTLSLLQSVVGVGPGQDVGGNGIQDGTTVTSVVLSPFSATGDTHTNNVIDNIAVPGGETITVGDGVSGTGIPADTEVVSVSQVIVTYASTLNSTTTIEVPTTLGIVVNQTVSGFGIPASTLVSTITPFSLTTAGDLTLGSVSIINLVSTTGVVVGQTVTGFGIPGGAVVVTIVSPTAIDMSLTATQTTLQGGVTFSGAAIVISNAATQTATFVNVTFGSLSVGITHAATATAAGVALTFTSATVVLSAPSLFPNPQSTVVTFSGATITMSAAATASGPAQVLTISGGTGAAPLWGAGDCDRNPLLSTPLGVAQFNGRAYFADGFDGIPFSDSGFPCRRSNQPNVQALTTSDGLSVTAIAPLMLSSPITGGIVQSLIAFEGDGVMRQITGDPATNDLRMNVMPIATGTNAPLSVIPCSLGTAFISPQGLRFVRSDGTVSDPVGIDGKGIINPFQFAVSPSRICAEANVAVLRITVQNGDKSGNPFEEYWFDLSRQTWSGPHSFPARAIQHWRGTFVMAPIRVPSTLWRSDAYQTPSSTFIEQNRQLSWIEETVLLPDNAQMAMNAMVEGNIMLSAAVGDTVPVVALDEEGLMLDAVLLQPATADLRQRALHWTKPVIAKQMSVRVSGTSNDSVRSGNLYMRYEILGYNNDDTGDDDNFLLGNDGMTILDSNASDHLAPG